ncbi:MAG: hypothetical protein RIS76_4052 [Verrucomicrobiota bacterium]
MGEGEREKTVGRLGIRFKDKPHPHQDFLVQGMGPLSVPIRAIRGKTLPGLV